MEAFIVENIVGKRATVNCGNGDVYTGIVEGCMNGMLTMTQSTGEIYINLQKIQTIKETK